MQSNTTSHAFLLNEQTSKAADEDRSWESCMTAAIGMASLFVYGTLMPGQARWSTLDDYVIGRPVPASTAGSLHDTGRGFPALWTMGEGTVDGYLLRLDPSTLSEALELLDEIEGVDAGLFRRAPVTVDVPGEGRETAFAYTVRHEPHGRRISSWRMGEADRPSSAPARRPSDKRAGAHFTFAEARRRLQELAAFVDAGAIGRAAPWGGAGVVVTNRHDTASASSKSFYPASFAVVTPYVGELSWLFEELWAALSPAVGACKYAFFGDLADAAVHTRDLDRLMHETIAAAEGVLAGRRAESFRAGSDAKRTTRGGRQEVTRSAPAGNGAD